MGTFNWKFQWDPLVRTFNWNLPWDFSDCSVDGNLMPVGDLDCSVLLDINYEIDIDIKRSGLHRNMDIHIPIHIGNFSSKGLRFPARDGLIAENCTRMYRSGTI